MNADEIIADIVLNRLSDSDTVKLVQDGFQPEVTEEDRLQVIKTGFNPAAYAKVAFGRWIRNSYGLWAEDNPHTLAHPQMTEDPDCPYHPDNLSGDILEEVIRRVRNI